MFINSSRRGGGEAPADDSADHMEAEAPQGGDNSVEILDNTTEDSQEVVEIPPASPPPSDEWADEILYSPPPRPSAAPPLSSPSSSTPSASASSPPSSPLSPDTLASLFVSPSQDSTSSGSSPELDWANMDLFSQNLDHAAARMERRARERAEAARRGVRRRLLQEEETTFNKKCRSS